MKMKKKKKTFNNKKRKRMKTRITPILFIISFSLGLFLIGCKDKSKTENNKENKFETLIEYIENNSDFINSEAAPAAVNSSDVMSKMDNNIHIIDIRMKDDFNQAHISGSANVAFSDLIEYFENKIDPNSFEGIYIYSSDGQASFFATAILRLLGYENVFAVRYGMASWNRIFAEETWLKKLSTKHEDKLVKENNSKPEKGNYPEVFSDKTSAYEIIKERAQELLNQKYSEYYKTSDEVFANPEKYFIACYWKKDYFELGHITGSVHYAPKKTLSRATDLSTLPIDKPIIIYCNAGNHSSAVVAYLRILGYDAYSLHYGTNEFMYEIMTTQTDNAFTESHIMNYQTISSDNTSQTTKQKEDSKPAVSQGGC